MERFRLSAVAIAGVLALAVLGCESSATGLPGDLEHDDLQPGHALLADGIDVTLGMEADHLEPGGEATLVLENQSGERIGYNLCFHTLERFTDEGWNAAEEQEERACILVLHMIDSGESARYDTSLPEALPAGEYRFRVALHLMERGEHRDQVTASFAVEP